MTPIANEQFLSLRKNAELIEADHYGEKVLKLSDGSFLKLFRRKRLISSEMLLPYARRFALNAEKLAELHIPCPKIIATYRIASIKRTAVHYWPLPGTTLRQELQYLDAAELAQKCRGLGAFIAMLHAEGVYFRSLHLGNIVTNGQSSLGLIDLADMRIGAAALSWQKRQRNFRHLFRYATDVAKLLPYRDEFIAGYCEKLTGTESKHFSSFLNARFLDTQSRHAGQNQTA